MDELIEGISPYLFHLFVKNLKDYALFTLSLQGSVTTWNVTAEHLFGYSRDEIIGQPLARFYPSEDVSRGVPDQELADARMDGQTSDDRWLVKRDGTRFWASGVTTYLEDQEPAGFAKFIRDQTTWKTSEDRIVHLNEQLEGKIAAYQDAVQELERINGQLAQANQSLLEAQSTLREKVAELEQFEQAVVGRELKMIELEKELVRLRSQLEDQ